MQRESSWFQCDQVEAFGRAEDTSAIPAHRGQRLNLHRQLLRTSFLNSTHSSWDGICFMVNQSLLPCDLKWTSDCCSKYKFHALVKASLELEPCCVIQKECSRQTRMANHILSRNKKCMKKSKIRPMKAGKEGTYQISKHNRVSETERNEL